MLTSQIYYPSSLKIKIIDEIYEMLSIINL